MSGEPLNQPAEALFIEEQNDHSSRHKPIDGDRELHMRASCNSVSIDPMPTNFQTGISVRCTGPACV